VKIGFGKNKGHNPCALQSGIDKKGGNYFRKKIR